ncbi:MAG: UDP-N-acetylglucosamine 2-epimerase (non-hydrolyzing) [Bacteroidota bacterium]|jgi:UDP-GlcNAc3NAcA epimerase|nr:UDP-N-acetylglucosamine 2-epimerase (non-hydrolyzing) [Bacteroidota bacterium]
MIKILTIIGARPQIIKAAALSRAVRGSFSDSIKEIIVHTGQHYDENMSGVFFDELDIPRPDYNLNAGSGSHGKQTAFMIEGIEEILQKEKPNAIILYGDTNSTLAGAIAASKIHVPVVHIEAGLRSFNKAMPEEINRIMCDHASTLLFSPTRAGYDNLLKEGFKEDNRAPYTADNPKIYHCGDVMYDNSLHFSAVAEQQSDILEKNGLEKNNFILSTIHRNNNTDEPERLNALFSAMNAIAEENKLKVVLPLHPRTAKLLSQNLSSELYSKIKTSRFIIIIPPVSFLEMIALEKNASLVMTDSGGVQKEAFFFKKPCIILRSETEWVELVNCGSAKIVDANEKKIKEAFIYFNNAKDLQFPQLFGDGKSSEFICSEILKTFSTK